MVIADQPDAELRENWRNRIHSDRPAYECPKCKKSAMQFHALLAEDPGRENFYHCYACGSFWEM